MKRSLSLLLLLLCAIHLLAQEATYRNPVIAGDLADPTVIRVGDTYFAAGTSSEWALPYRLYESKDLVNWQYLGALFDQMPSWTMGSYWAPELFYHHDTYFLYYTARRRSDQKSFVGVATTKDIRKGFTDHGLLIEWTNEAIDAFVIEENGQLYITWKAYGLDKGRNIELLAAPLSADGLKIEGEAFSLLTSDTDTWEAGGIEGQCLVRHGEYLYLFYAGNNCCGADCNYMTGVARAKTIHGPWQKYAGNPILHSDSQWRCPGHGTLVTTPANRYFYLYHAYNNETNVHTGRQGMLDEILWDNTTGWPYFRYGKTPSIQAEAPYTGTVQQETANWEDNFTAPTLHPEWMWDATKAKPQYSITQGKLLLQAPPSEKSTFLGLRPRKSSYTLSATLSTSTPAGIYMYGSKENMLGIALHKGQVQLTEIRASNERIVASTPLVRQEATLFVEVSFAQFCHFGYIIDGTKHYLGDWIYIAQLPQWDRPPMVGIRCEAPSQATISQVRIQYK